MPTSGSCGLPVKLLVLALICSCCRSIQHAAAAAAGPSYSSSSGISSSISSRSLKQFESATEIAQTCPTGCYRANSTACSSSGGCAVNGTAGSKTLCCTSDTQQQADYTISAGGLCDKTTADTVLLYFGATMEAANTAFNASGSVMKLLSLTAQCVKRSGSFSVPTAFKAKTKYQIRIRYTYRGTRHVRDFLTFSRQSGPCNGMLQGLCDGLYQQQKQQTCLSDSTGGISSCEWLVARQSVKTCPPSSPCPQCPTDCNNPEPSPSPPPDYGDYDPNPTVHPDQAVLLQGKYELARSYDVLDDWKAGTNMCRDNWEGIYCYDKGANKGAVNRIVLDSAALAGRLPPGWSKLAAVRVINLESNELTGSLPATWQSMSKMETLRVAGNKLSGSFPQVLADGMTALANMSLYGNADLGGCMPSTLRSKKFGMFTPTGGETVKSVGVGGDTTLVPGDGALSGTNITGWC